MLNPCSFCTGECCKTYTITVTIFDVLRIVKATGRPISTFVELHEPRLLSYDPDCVLDTSDGSGYYLLGLKSHPCVFLDKDNLCTIHKDAPLSCRRYPFKASGEYNSRFCPLASQILFRLGKPDIGTDDLLRELDAHKKIVKEWNLKNGTKKECVTFLLEKGKSFDFG